MLLHRRILLLLLLVVISFTIPMKIFSAPGDNLYGTYLYVSETSTIKLKAGAEIVLKLQPSGIVDLRANQPGQALSSRGTFSVEPDAISLSLPELDITVSKGQFSLKGNELVLPFLLFGEGKGASTWEKVDVDQNPVSKGAALFGALVGKGVAAEQALAQAAAQIAQHPHVARVDTGKHIIQITYKSGYQEYFLAVGNMAMVPSVGWSDPGGPRVQLASCQIFNPDTLKLTFDRRYLAWLANEPDPVSHGDAPADKSVLILSPFHTLPVYMATPDKRSKTTFKYQSFSDGKEDLNSLKRIFARINYKTDIFIDDQVTVKTLYERFNRTYGAVYFHTHGGILPRTGGDCLLGTGIEVPLRIALDPDEEVRRNYCHDYLVRELGAEAAAKLEPYVALGKINEDSYFFCVRSGFFNQTQGDYSRSLIFLDGCEVVESKPLRRALHPKAMVGWNGDMDLHVSGYAAPAFWACLSLRTRGDREAVNFTKNYLAGEVIGKEVAISSSRDAFDPRHLTLYRRGKDEPERPFTNNQFQMIMTVRDWSCRKGGEDLTGLIAKLLEAKPEDMKHGVAVEPLYRQAFFAEVPPRREIEGVQWELCGGGPDPRFTMVEGTAPK